MRIGAIVAAAAILVLLAYEVAHGTKRTIAVGFLVAVLIPLSVAAIERPLLFPFGLYVILAPFESILQIGGYGTINKMVGIVTFLAVLFLLARRGQLVKPSASVLVWLALVIWMGLSGFWTLDQQNWQAAYLTLAQNFILYALVSLVIATPADIEILSSCAVIGGLAASAVAIWPLVTGGEILTAGARITLFAGNGPGGEHADPNVFAASLLLPFAILFSSTLASRGIGSLLGNIAGLGLIVVTIVVTGSRAGMLAMLVMTLFIVFAKPRGRILGLGLVVLAGLLMLPFGFDIQNRWANAISSGGAGRTDIWQVGMLAFQQHWLFGWGYGSFEAAFDRFVLQAPLTSYISWHRAPHDILLETGVDLGVFGVLFVAIAFFVQFRDLALPRVGGFLDDLRVALQATILGLCIDALFLDFLDAKFLWILFTLIALTRSTIVAKRRTACAAPPSRTLGPVSAQPRSSALSSRLKTDG